MTIAMTLSQTAEGTVEKTSTGAPKKNGTSTYENSWTVLNKESQPIQETSEFVSKINTTKYSNKELLTDLKALGRISDIAGWTLRAVFDEEGKNMRFYLLKPGSSDSLSVTEYFTIEENALAEAKNTRTVSKITYEKDNVTPVSSTSTKTSVSTDKRNLTMSLTLRDITTKFNTTVSGSSKLFVLGKSPDLFEATLPGAFKFSSISGVSAPSDSVNPEESQVVEGAWTIGAARTVNDVSALFPPQ